METLNSTSLYDALNHCNDNRNYKAIIVFETRSDANEFAREMYLMHSNNPIPGFDKVFVGSGSDSRINFKNGSRIEMISASSELRAKKCNELLYHENVDVYNGNLNLVLRSMLVPYKRGTYECFDGEPTTKTPRLLDKFKQYERYKREAQQTEELDEFLNSFVVTS